MQIAPECSRFCSSLYMQPHPHTNCTKVVGLTKVFKDAVRCEVEDITVLFKSGIKSVSSRGRDDLPATHTYQLGFYPRVHSSSSYYTLVTSTPADFDLCLSSSRYQVPVVDRNLSAQHSRLQQCVEAWWKLPQPRRPGKYAAGVFRNPRCHTTCLVLVVR